MTISVHKRQGQPREIFRINPVAVGCTLLMLASGAYAQQTAATLETVTVTGIRKGIEDAISVKKNADSIVEAISAEDIGKLPDSSIAESIARLPGVTAQRVAGRAQNISVRGMSSDFSTALLNGREQVSTGDNRGVEFDQYPSELLSGVVVYKTPDGMLLGQGLSGTIDMQTVRPLAFGKRAFAANVRGVQSGVGTEFKGDGKRFSLSYIDQFADRTFGIAVGYARTEAKAASSRSESYNTTSTIKWDGTTVSPSWDGAAPGNVVTINGGFKLFNDNSKETRDALMATLEYKPSNQLSSTLDLFYSKFDKDLTSRGLEVQPDDSWKGAASPQYPGLKNPVITGGRLISGTWTNVNPLARTIWDPTKDELKSIGWNTKYKFSDKWTGIADLSTSSATRNEKIVEMEAANPTPQTMTIANFNQISAFQFNNGDRSLVKLMDPEGWGQNGYHKATVTDDKINALRFGLSRDLDGFLSKLDFGMNYTDRTKTKDSVENKLILKGGVGSKVDLPASATAVAVGGSSLNSISLSPADIFPSAYNLVPNLFADIWLKSWKVAEKATTFYTKGEIDSQLGGMPLRGNIGLQVINTDQSSTAPGVDTTNESVMKLVTQGRTYTDVLPSLNLNLSLGNDQSLRFAAAQVMARARMDQMSAGRRGEVGNDQKWSGSGGNPLLDPFRANALDISYEKYFGTKAYFSAAAFYKQLKTYVFDYTDATYDFSSFTNLSSRVPLSKIGKFTQPRNGNGGRISGVELAASLPLSQLTPMLDGFGVVASVSDTSSAIKPFGDGDTRSLPGLSRTVSTLTAYYEKYGFSARVAQRNRSDFLGEITGFGASRTYTYIKAESIIDLQLGYEFQAGAAKGLSLLLQVNNANDAKYQEFDSVTGSVNKTNAYGKTVMFGLNYKL